MKALGYFAVVTGKGYFEFCIVTKSMAFYTDVGNSEVTFKRR